MTATPHDDARPSRWRQALSWGGGGAAFGGFAVVACGACTAAVPPAAVLGVAGGLGLTAGGLGFVLAGGSAIGLVARRRVVRRNQTAAGRGCCAPALDATSAGEHVETPSMLSSPAMKEIE
jgi:hypothetical protein